MFEGDEAPRHEGSAARQEHESILNQKLTSTSAARAEGFSPQSAAEGVIHLEILGS